MIPWLLQVLSYNCVGRHIYQKICIFFYTFQAFIFIKRHFFYDWSTPIVIIWCFSWYDWNAGLIITHFCSIYSMEINFFGAFVKDLGLVHCSACALIPSVFKQRYYFPEGRNFLDVTLNVAFIGNFIESYHNCTWSENLLLSPGFMTLWLFFLIVENTVSCYQYSQHFLTNLLCVRMIMVWFESYFLVRYFFACNKLQWGINRMEWYNQKQMQMDKANCAVYSCRYGQSLFQW